MSDFKSILLAEGNVKDVELMLEALSEYHLANDVVIARDGTEALDYLYQRGSFKVRTPGTRAMILLDVKIPGKTD